MGQNAIWARRIIHAVGAGEQIQCVVQETGCVSENMSTILLVMPFTIST